MHRLWSLKKKHWIFLLSWFNFWYCWFHNVEMICNCMHWSIQLIKDNQRQKSHSSFDFVSTSTFEMITVRHHDWNEASKLRKKNCWTEVFNDSSWKCQWSAYFWKKFSCLFAQNYRFSFFLVKIDKICCLPNMVVWCCLVRGRAWFDYRRRESISAYIFFLTTSIRPKTLNTHIKKTDVIN